MFLFESDDDEGDDDEGDDDEGDDEGEEEGEEEGEAFPILAGWYQSGWLLGVGV